MFRELRIEKPPFRLPCGLHPLLQRLQGLELPGHS